MKLGCVFTQTTTDEPGRPVRDEASTTYTGAIESAEEFGHRLYAEAWERGWSRAAKKVIIGDGAEWIWNIAEQHFPGRRKSWTCIMHGNISGNWRVVCILVEKPNRSVG
ncbi:MAG: hypothetical protein WA324_23315 [Bryobacteraceae bacterium]